MNILAIMTAYLSFLFNAIIQSQEIEMSDGIRANGMIYVLVCIILLILGGLIFYLFTIDRKVKKLEKESSDLENG